MDREAWLRAIGNGQVEWLNTGVDVSCDPLVRLPMRFTFKGRWHEIEQIIEVARDDMDANAETFLIRTGSGQVFALCRRLDLVKAGCWWWIAFRVLGSEEVICFDRRRRQMLIDLELKLLADGYGHLCPDFAIGWRVGLFARRVFGENGGNILAGCLSCASEALAAMGTWNLKIDALMGRHFYRLEVPGAGCVELDVPDELTWPDGDFAGLERQVSENRASILEIASYQIRIDEQISRILAATDQELFSPTMSR